MVHIYVLKLDEGKYYVGKSNQPNIRIEDHYEENGSSWTKKYKPISIEKIIENCDEFDEDKYTKMYMNKYGIDNVRGGSYVQIYLDDNIIQLLEKELKSANDLCFRCGLNNHFIYECTLSDQKNESTFEQIKEKIEPRNNISVCKRCGRSNHEKAECYAKTHFEGYELKVDKSSDSDSSEEYIKKNERPCVCCGKRGHKPYYCKTMSEVCFRCGKDDHWKITCTEIKDINGYKLKSHIVGEIGSFIKSFF